jgi:arylsulfatase A-like enzyme
LKKAIQVLLITIDSLRRDRLEAYGYGQPNSPYLRELAGSGSVADLMISNGGGTPETFPAMMASTARTHEFHTMKDSRSIAEVMRSNGYKTAAFHSNPYISRIYSYDKGFDTFYDGTGSRSRHAARVSDFLDTLRAKPPIDRAEMLTDMAIKWLKSNRGEPTFLWIHYMDVHTPYIPPREYMQKYLGRNMGFGESRSLFQRISHVRGGQTNPISEKEVVTLTKLYNACIAYVDDCIKKLANQIASVEHVTVVTADHGEEFGEHGYFGHGPLYDTVIRVPFIIESSRGKQPISTELSCTLDVAPTILDVCGIPPEAAFRGRSIVEESRPQENPRQAVVSWSNRPRFSYRTKKWKLILVGPEPFKKELYNLELDPYEKENQASSKPELVDILSEGIPMWIEQNKSTYSTITRRVAAIRNNINSKPPN